MIAENIFYSSCVTCNRKWSGRLSLQLFNFIFHEKNNNYTFGFHQKLKFEYYHLVWMIAENIFSSYCDI